MVVDRQSGTIAHKSIADIADYLHAGDLLIGNDSRVLACRTTVQTPTGRQVEGLFLPTDPRRRDQWVMMAKGVKPVQQVTLIDAPEKFSCHIGERLADGSLSVTFDHVEKVAAFLERGGRMPLPPYILKQRHGEEWSEDSQRYQTVYADAQHLGSVAAPTAGLHFTPALLQHLKTNGVEFATVTLHVGRGTFQPITTEDIREHRMGREWFHLPPTLWQRLQTKAATAAATPRVVAIGTTTVRTLESAAQLGVNEGWTDIYIYPGYQITTINALLTNFHLPGSTLLLMVMAFAGEELIRQAYDEAVAKRYHFYSYGDAMLIL